MSWDLIWIGAMLSVAAVTGITCFILDRRKWKAVKMAGEEEDRSRKLKLLLSLGSKTCQTCSKWEEDDAARGAYSFIKRLEAQKGRRIRMGYCTLYGDRAGPTVDGDSCSQHQPRKTTNPRER